MAAFNVGDIEGRLTLDRSPFTEGLARARQQADEFERGDYNARLGVDTAEADAEIAATKTELEDLDHTRATPRVSVNTSGQRRQVGLLVAAIVALGPAAVAAGGIAAGALAPLALGAVGITAIALPALKELHDAATKTGDAQQKALASLGPGALPAVAAFKAMTGAWSQFRAQLNPALFALLRQTFLLIQATLPAMVPFLRSFAGAVTQLVHGLIPLAPTFGRAFSSMMPIVTMVTVGVLHLAQALAHWTAGAGFQHFIAYVVQNGPLLWHTLAAVAMTIVQLGIAAGPVLPVLLQLTTALAHLLTLILQIPGVGPVLVTLGLVGVTAWKVTTMVKGLIGAWETFGMVFPRIAAALSSSFAALFANPIVLGIAAVAAVLYILIKQWHDVGEFLQTLWKGLADVYNNTLGLIPGMPHANAKGPTTTLQGFVNDVRKAEHGDKAAAERLRQQKAQQEGPQLPQLPSMPALGPPSMTGITGIIKPDPKKPQTAYEGFNPTTGQVEKHTSDQWRHIHVLNQKRQHDLAVTRGKQPKTQQAYEGVNPFSNELEMHTSADWRHIHNLYTQHQRAIANAPGTTPRHSQPQVPYEGFNRLTGRIEMHTADEWRHIHVVEQQRAFNRNRKGPTGLPRAVAHTFSGPAGGGGGHLGGGAVPGLGPDIVGQTVVFNHPRDYGQKRKPRGETLQEQGNRELRSIHDLLAKQHRRGAGNVIKLDIGGRSEHIDTETRRRGRAAPKR